MFRFIIGPHVVLMLIASTATGVNIDDYGAAGDAATWDHAAIQAAINAAGPGGLVEFSPGKTYVSCAHIRPLAGQTLRGNGAVLKRCDAVTALLTQNAVSGTQVLEVSDPSVFEIGQSLTPVKGPGGYADGEFVIEHILESVNGQVLTVSNALKQDYPAGSIVTVKFDQIHVANTSTNVVIEDLVFDGNRESNNIYLSWTDNKAIRGFSDLIVRNSTFQNLPGNGITAFGTNVLIADNIFRDLDGPIVHLSGNRPVNGSSVTIARNVVSNTNEQADRMQHSEGVITISAYNYSINVLDNVVDNAAVPFISRFHAEMGDWLIRGNRVSRTAGIFFAKVWPGEALTDITFENNIFRNVGESRSLRREGAEPIKRFNFINNQLIGGSLNLEGLEDSEITGNTIKSCNIDPIVLTGDTNVSIAANDTSDEYCLFTLQVEAVRHQSFWDRLRHNLSEFLAHLIGH